MDCHWSDDDANTCIDHKYCPCEISWASGFWPFRLSLYGVYVFQVDP